MSENRLFTLQQEWITLQTQFDSYEKCSLGIKLFSILSCIILTAGLDNFIAAIIVLNVIWLQDAIWKTFQSRIAERLEVVEAAIKEYQQGAQITTADLGMQFNSVWLSNRPTALVLIGVYLKQALKPTVAYPHVVLILLVAAAWLLHT